MQQGELFEVSRAMEEKTSERFSKARTGWMDQFQVTLRLDHLSIFAILALVLYVLVFSFGVEKGKSFALDELAAQKDKEAQIAKELAEKPATLPPAVSETPKPAPAPAPIPVLPSPPKPDPRLPDGQGQASPAVVPTAVTGGKYTLQLVTYVAESRAQKEVERLKSIGLAAFILPVGIKFQVCAFGFESFKEAKEKLTTLKKEGFVPTDAFIRPLNTAF